jgi:hypothetical protein
MILLSIFAINWIAPFILSWAYALWLWKFSHDMEFKGWIRVGGIFPVAKFRLISKKSWYAKLWQDWYGMGFMGIVLYRDEPGIYDDAFVKMTLIHEPRHCLQGYILGLLFWILYVVDLLLIYFFIPARHPYLDNWFERDARRVSGDQVDFTPDQWPNGPNDRWPWWSNPTDEQVKEDIAKWRYQHPKT